jgi:hypothetical protein
MRAWEKLAKELDCWGESGAIAKFWWRDDDAVAPTNQLEALLRCAGSTPLALAVVPGLATFAIADRLRDHTSVVVLQHGWRHANHALEGNSEYPKIRPEKDVARELVDGRNRLAEFFGAQALPVFVPPWHGFDACFLPILRPSGLTAISLKGPRSGAMSVEGVFQANAHVSPIMWANPPSFGEDDIYLDQLIDHLSMRRLGLVRPGRANGSVDTSSLSGCSLLHLHCASRRARVTASRGVVAGRERGVRASASMRVTYPEARRII